MTTRLHPAILLAVAALAIAQPVFAARAVSDLTPPQRRQTTVEIAERLANREPPADLPDDMPSPFNPVGFDAPDPSLLAGQNRDSSPAVVAAPSDRQVLENLAQRLTPSGTFIRDGKPLLVIDRNRFEIGTKFIVTYEERDYELQLVSIDRTTFTLRYRSEEITRSIKPLK